MESMQERINKLREERLAREKARIEKLRELNLKKYNKNEPQPRNTQSSSAIPVKLPQNDKFGQLKRASSVVKNNFHVNGTTKKPLQPVVKKSTIPEVKPLVNKTENIKNVTKPTEKLSQSRIGKFNPNAGTSTNKSNPVPNPVRKSLAPKVALTKPTAISRKSMLPKPPQTSSETVFERLYKPKMVSKEHVDSVKKLKSDPSYLNKVIKNTNLIFNKRHTMCETKKAEVPVRRSISAVHFKRISKNELQNCIHKWASIGDKMNRAHMTDINEDEHIKEDKVVSAVKSERKRVTFMTPVPQNFNTPRPEELQARLKNWLQKRGKSLDSYHHLQCFGINHLVPRDLMVDFEPINYDDDEDKENMPVESDSDDDSFSENMGKGSAMVGTWRRASIASESVEFNDTTDTTVTTNDTDNSDELVIGALNDLTELLKEGFDWEQSARWLRSIRERFPTATNTAAYWECRAALEETRGDLPASVQCWEEAIAKGTQHSVVEANLDQLLDKFMQLKISPNSGKGRQVDPKMVDVKNIFKSTIIRFAVQQAKLRGSPGGLAITPVRRSSRLGGRVASSVKQLHHAYGQLPFVPNRTLTNTP